MARQPATIPSSSAALPASISWNRTSSSRALPRRVTPAAHAPTRVQPLPRERRGRGPRRSPSPRVPATGGVGRPSVRSRQHAARPAPPGRRVPPCDEVLEVAGQRDRTGGEGIAEVVGRGARARRSTRTRPVRAPRGAAQPSARAPRPTSPPTSAPTSAALRRSLERLPELGGDPVEVVGQLRGGLAERGPFLGCQAGETVGLRRGRPFDGDADLFGGPRQLSGTSRDRALERVSLGRRHGLDLGGGLRARPFQRRQRLGRAQL